MATGQQIVDRIKRRLSRKSDIILPTDILDEANAAMETLESKPTLPKFLSSAQNMTGTGSHSTLDFATLTGFLRLADLGLWVNNPTIAAIAEPLTQLTQDNDYQVLISRALGTGDATALPERYAMLGRVAQLRPRQIVDRAYVVFCYQRDPIALTLGNSNLWSTNAPGLLTAYAGIRISRYLRDKEALQLFIADRNEAMADFLRSENAADDAAQEYVMGDD